MVFFKLKFHVVIFFSLVVFLLLRQSVSKQDNVPSRLLQDSKLSISRKINLPNHESSGDEAQDEVGIPESSSDANKKVKQNKETDKENEINEEKEKREKDNGEEENENEDEEKEEKKDKIKKKKKNDEDNEKKDDEEEEGIDIKKKKKKKDVESEESSSASSSTPSSFDEFKSIDSLLSLPNVLKNDPLIPPVILKSCKKADYPLICQATLLVVKKDTKKLDATGLFESSSKALSIALVTAKTSVADPNIDISTKVVDDCLDMYKDATSALKSAMKSAKKNDRYMTSLKLSTVLSDIDTCQEGVGKSTSKLAEANVILSKMASNTICLADALMHFKTDP